MRLGRRTIRAQASTEECSDSIFTIRAHCHDFGTKQQPSHPANGYPLDFHRLIPIWERNPNRQFHAWYDLMVTQHPEPVPAKVDHRSLSKKISAQVIEGTTNGNPVVGADHELIGVGHCSACSPSPKGEMSAVHSPTSMEQTILVGSGSSLALQERGPAGTLNLGHASFRLTVSITTC